MFYLYYFFTITGGLVGSSGDYSTKTTELITYDPPSVKEGPLIPEYFNDHCSVLIGDVAYLIGGMNTASIVLAINIRTSDMTYKSDLNHGHSNHACAQITGSNPKIVISGGYDGNGDLKSTEIYDIANDSWEMGK